MLSDCCKAEINHSKYDKCSLCNREIGYALMTPSWARRESCGVYKDFDDNLWFFWQRVSCWDLVEEFTKDGGHQYLGQIKEMVDSLTARLNKDSDRIGIGRHISFMKEYVDKVKNPEIMDLLLNG